MKNETLLKRLIELKNSLAKGERELIDGCINKNFRWGDGGNTASILTNLILDVKEDMVAENAKKNGVGEQLKCAKRILKRAPEQLTALKYAYTDEAGVQTICDSFCMVRLPKPLDLPELPPDKEYVNVKRLMPKQNNPIELELPELSKLKAYHRLKKVEKVKNICYDFGEGLPLVDVEILIDVMTLVPNAKCTYEGMTLVFTNDEGAYGLLCKVHKATVYHSVKTEV